MVAIISAFRMLKSKIGAKRRKLRQKIVEVQLPTEEKSFDEKKENLGLDHYD